MIHIALYQPEIPPNTGNIIRLCANTGALLHLIYPIGFMPNDKQLKRAGLDYHDWAKIFHHKDYEAFLNTLKPERLFAISTKGSKIYTKQAYQEGDVLLFGPETRGLPECVLKNLTVESILRIPMIKESRSLNLANSVAVVLYEALRQTGFDMLS